MNPDPARFASTIAALDAELSSQLGIPRPFLIGDSTQESVELAQEFTDRLNQELAGAAVEKLAQRLSEYQSAVKLLALEMESADNYSEELKLKLEQGFESEIITNFVRIRQLGQQLILELIAVLTTSYSLREIPLKSIQIGLQSISLDDLSVFDFAADFIEFPLENPSVYKQGRPDSELLAQVYRTNFDINNDLSTNAVLGNLNRYLDAVLVTSTFGPEVTSYFQDKLTVLISPELKFFYEQLFTNQIPIPEVRANVESKFPHPIQELVRVTTAETKDWGADYTEVIDLLRELAPEKIYSREYPPIYRLEFRGATAFEVENYSAVAGADVYLLAEQGGELVLTLGAVISTAAREAAKLELESDAD